jgi:hypothetical protein
MRAGRKCDERGRSAATVNCFADRLQHLSQEITLRNALLNNSAPALQTDKPPLQLQGPEVLYNSGTLPIG